MSAPNSAESVEAVCRCDCAYVGAQMVGTPTRCERCGGLVDEVASVRMEAVYEASRKRLEEWAAENPIRPTPPGEPEPQRVEPPKCGTCFTSGWYGSRTGEGHLHCDCGRPCIACPTPAHRLRNDTRGRTFCATCGASWAQLDQKIREAS